MFEDALLLTRMTSHRDLDALSLILIVLSLSLSPSLSRVVVGCGQSGFRDHCGNMVRASTKPISFGLE